jgi:undecaprenyl-diphosphatase
MNPVSRRSASASVLVLLAAILIFGVIAKNVVSGGPLGGLDRDVAAWFHARTTSTGIHTMLAITQLGGFGVVTTISMLMGLFLLRSQIYDRFVQFLLIVPTGMLFTLLLKFVFRRVRLDYSAVTTTGYSFPSGHTMAATLLYGFLALFAISHLRSGNWRLLVFITATSLVVAVGFSRIYLGAHYLSDVLGALTAGLGWLIYFYYRGWVLAGSLRTLPAVRECNE